MDGAAVGHDLRPVQLAAVGVGVEGDIADLTDAEAAVEEVLEGVADQVEEMVRGAHGMDGNALHFLNDGALMDLFEKAVEIAVGIGLGGEEALVKLNVQGTAGLLVGHLVRISDFFGLRGGLHAGGDQDAVAGIEIVGGDQQILVIGVTGVRLGIETAAHQALDHQGLEPCGMKALLQGEKFGGLSGLDGSFAGSGLGDRGQQGGVVFDQRSIAANGAADHGQHILLICLVHELLPLFGSEIFFDGGRDAQEGCLKGREKILIDQIHLFRFLSM